MVAMLAQGCGQQAVSVEAERLFGRALKLAMVSQLEALAVQSVLQGKQQRPRLECT